MCYKVERIPEVEEKIGEILSIIAQNDNDPKHLIPILQQIQNLFNYLPEEAIYLIAELLDIPAARIYGVATFYSGFSLEKKGKYIIKICNGTACHVKGSMSIVDSIKEKIGLTDGAGTTNDMLFTMELVSCVGACGLAPVVVINEDVHGQVKDKTMLKEIEKIMQNEVSYVS